MEIIVNGGSKLSYFLVKHLLAHEHKVSVIVADSWESQILSRTLEASVINGNGAIPSVQEEAGARTADVFFSLSLLDHENLVACQIASRRFEVPKTIAMVQDPENESTFRKFGVSLVFSATRLITSLLEQQTGFLTVTNLISMAKGQLTLSEVTINDESPALNSSLKQLSLPQGFLIATVSRNNNIFVPDGDTVLLENDQIVLIGKTDEYEEALKKLSGSS